MWCFIQVLANLGEAMTDEEIGDMVKEADLDLDGQVSFDGGCFALNYGDYAMTTATATATRNICIFN